MCQFIELAIAEDGRIKLHNPPSSTTIIISMLVPKTMISGKAEAIFKRSEDGMLSFPDVLLRQQKHQTNSLRMCKKNRLPKSIISKEIRAVNSELSDLDTNTIPQWKENNLLRDHHRAKVCGIARDRMREKYVSRKHKTGSYKEQSGYSEMGATFLAELKAEFNADWFDRLENTQILINNLLDALCFVPAQRAPMSLMVTLATHYKLVTKQPCLPAVATMMMDVVSYLRSALVPQSGFEEATAEARKVLDYWPRMKSSPLWKKLRTVLVYMSLLTTTGKCTLDQAKTVEGAHISIDSPDMVYAILDLTLFVAERGYQIYKTGSVDCIFHSGGTYETWYQDSIDLLAKLQFIHNPEAHGIDVHEVLKKLDVLLAQGKSIHRNACELDRFASKLVATTLEKLVMAKATQVNTQFSQQTRKAPFCVLVEGQSNVGKTTFATMLHYFYGVVMNKDVSPGNRYTVNPGAKYLDGFVTAMWSILLDDIGCYNPNKMADVDPTLRNMLLFANSTPHTPDQAALDKKGQTPMRCDLLVATTNVPELNLGSYFAVPFAVARRFPYHFRLRPKSVYQNSEDATRLDPMKVPAYTYGEYPDLWDIDVYEPFSVPAYLDEKMDWCQKAELRKTRSFASVHELFKWLGPVIKTHDQIQVKIVKSEHLLANTSICNECYGTQQWCTCETPTFIAPRLDAKFMREQNGYELGVVVTLLGRVITELFPLATRFVGNVAADVLARIVAYVMCVAYVRQRMYRMVPRLYQGVTHGHQYARDVMRTLGTRVYESMKTPKAYIALMSITGAAVGTYQLYKWYKGLQTEQVGLSDIGEPPVVRTERESVWVNSTHVPTTFDVGHLTSSWNALSKEQVEEAILRNSVFLRFWDGTKFRTSKALGLCGQSFLTTLHTIPPFQTTLLCEIQRERAAPGVSGNFSFMLSESDLVRDVNNDLVVIRIRSVPPLKDITGLLMKESFGSYRGKGEYLGRATDGSCSKKTVTAIYTTEYKNKNLGITNTILSGTVVEPTVGGDCGWTLLVETGFGPIIAGIHQLGDGAQVTGAIKISAEMIEKMIDRTKITVPAEPLMDTTTTHVGKPGPLHFKSPVRFIQQGTAHVYGSFVGFRSEPKTTVKPTIMCKKMIDHGYQLAHGAPVMKGWLPWYTSLKDCVTMNGNIDSQIVDQCVEGLVIDWMKVRPEWKAELKIYDVHTSINGMPGVRFVDSINRRTSAGFPHRCSKKYLSVALEPTEQYPDAITFTPEILERTELILTRWGVGQRGMVVFSGALKDEALPFAKIEAGKTRVFMGAPVELTIAMRMVLLSFTRVVQKNKFVFEQFPGTEAQSVEWDFIRQHLTQFGEDRCIFGDFRGFDKTMSAVFILAAFEAIAQFHKKCGCSDQHVRMIYSMGYDICFALVDFNGDLIEFFGINPSGQALTVIINGIVNSLYMRYVYVKRNPGSECLTFQQYIALATYGDDNGIGVSPSIGYFNHTIIADVLAEIGVTYTMADKGAASIPFVHIDDGSFLKRTWRYEAELDAHVCPLEEASIIKSLMINTASKHITPEVHAVEIVHSAVQEYFWYGREVFEQKREFLLHLMEESGCLPYLTRSLPTWPSLVARYKRNSRGFLSEVEFSDRPTTKVYAFELEKEDVGAVIEVPQPDPLQAKKSLGGLFCVKPSGNFLDATSVESLRLQSDTMSCLTMGVPAEHTKVDRIGEQGSLPVLNQPQPTNTSFRSVGSTVTPQTSSAAETQNKAAGLTLQSGLEEPVTDGAAVGETTETAQFLDQTMGSTKHYSLAPAVYRDDLSGLELGDFLKRPTLIQSFTWPESGFGETSFDPWTLFMSNTRIADKLNNYSFFRGTLKLKIVMNAAPFYYGALYFAYTPIPGQVRAPDSIVQKYVTWSQRPGIWILPQDNAGGEMTLPFVWNQEFLDISSAATVAKMGQINILQYTTLASANGATSNGVTLQVYAWCEDAVLTGPTAKLSLQSGDEYGNGPVSAPAARLAKYASYLTAIPRIGPFAYATQIGASAVSSIAKVFGWTNVPVIDNVTPFKNLAYHDLASAHISEPTTKYFLDPKGEISVDPRIVGVDATDEMSIPCIVGKEAYLTTSTWATTDAASKLLFSSLVTPQLYSRSNITSGGSYFFAQTPMSMVAAAFQSWRGPVTFRFHFICSKYHKGRVRISWDPVATQGVTDDTNVIVTKIVDLGETNNVEFTVPYLQAKPWIGCGKIASNNWSTTAATASTANSNGTIQVRVLTNLSAPVDTASIQMFVFVRGQPEMEFANPRDIPYGKSTTFLQLQSGEEVPEQRYAVNFGEPVPTIRLLMRRSTKHSDLFPTIASAVTATDKAGRVYVRQGRLPPPNGYDPNSYLTAKGVETPATTYKFNYARMTPMNWFAPAYLANRGSVRWHYNVANTGGVVPTSVSITRVADVPLVANDVSLEGGYKTYSAAASTLSTARYNDVNATTSVGASGMFLTNSLTQAGVGVEYPMMSEYTFGFNKQDNWLLGVADDGSDVDNYEIAVPVNPATAVTYSGITIERFVSAGTDFSLAFFLNAPIIYYNPSLGTTPV